MRTPRPQRVLAAELREPSVAVAGREAVQQADGWAGVERELAELALVCPGELSEER